MLVQTGEEDMGQGGQYWLGHCIQDVVDGKVPNQRAESKVEQADKREGLERTGSWVAYEDNEKGSCMAPEVRVELGELGSQSFRSNCRPGGWDMKREKHRKNNDRHGHALHDLGPYLGRLQLPVHSSGRFHA